MAWATTSRGASSARGSIVRHEAVAVLVAEVGPLAADRLADEVPARAGDVEHGRVELHELHVAQLGPGAVGGGHAVAGGDGRVGRLAVDHAARRRWPGSVCLAQTSSLPRRGRQTSAPTQRPSWVSRSRVKVSSQSGDVRRPAGAVDDGPHHLVAGGVAQGVDDPAVAVAALAVRASWPSSWSNCVPQPIRSLICCGRLADDHLDDVAVAQARRRRSACPRCGSRSGPRATSTPAMPPWA